MTDLQPQDPQPQDPQPQDPQPQDPLSSAARDYFAAHPVDPLKASVAGAIQQDPDAVARARSAASTLGVPPAAAQAAPDEAARQAALARMGLDGMSLRFPGTARFLSNPDNAAVAHDDVDGLKAVEIALSDGSRQVIDVGTARADTRSAFTRFVESRLLPTLQGFPVTRAAIGVVGGSVGSVGDVGAFLGFHGGDGNAPNALQRFQRTLDPSVTGADTIMSGRRLPFDALAQNLGPLALGFGVGGASTATARVLGASERTAALVAGGGTGLAFTAQQGGAAYQQALDAGKTPDEARRIADRVALINTPANVLLGGAAGLPALRRFGAGGSLVLGAAQGASGQVAENYIEGRPLGENLLGGSFRGAAFMLGLHGAMESLGSIKAIQDASDVATESKLRARDPQAFADAVNGTVEGTDRATVRVPVDQFDRVFGQSGLDPEQVASDLKASNYAEARLAGTDVLVPTGDYLARVAGTPEGRELEAHARLSPEALTADELRTYLQEAPEAEASLRRQGEQAGAPDARAMALRSLSEDAQRQLSDAGFDPSTARTYAQLHANALVNLAERAGLDPTELQRRFPLTVGREADVPRGTSEEAVTVRPAERRAVGSRAAEIRDLIGRRKAGGLSEEESGRLHDLNEQERVQAKVGGADMPSVLNATGYADADAAGALKPTQVFADLDDFKRVNDTYGHAAGDDAIRALGKSLVAHFGEGNVFHRGGDEFVAQHETPEAADAAMEAVRADMDRFQVKGKDVRSGERRQQTGIGLSYGRGPLSDFVNPETGVRDPSHAAELDQYADKVRRKAEGKRVGVREDLDPGTEPTRLEQGPQRGFIQFGSGRRFQIGLLDGADLSTFLHETGHLYLELMTDLVKEPGASEQIKADLETLRRHAGAEGDAPLTTAQHETVARSLEAYLMEGRAPSDALRAAFDRVKNWLKVVYRSVRALNVNLSDEVRGVFDRIYASDAEIEAARARIGDDVTLFKSAREMGVSQQEYEDYVAARETADRTAKDALRRVLLGEYQHERQMAARVERERIRQEVVAEVDGSPTYRAIKALRDRRTEDGTEIKLNRDAVREHLGDDAFEALPRRFRQLYAVEGGTDPDGAAEVLGFRSGAEMLTALRDAPPRSEIIEGETQRRFRERNPDAMEDGSLPDRAAEASHTGARERVLAEELRALRRMQQARAEGIEAKRAARQGGEPSPAARRRSALQSVPPAETFRRVARAIISDTAVRDLDARSYLTAQRKGAREALAAAARGDFERAADAKQRELLSHHLFMEAQVAKRDVERVVRRATGLQKSEAQARLARSGDAFRAQVNALLDRYEMARVPLATLDRREALAAWAARMEAEGLTPDLSPEVLNESRRANYRQIPVGELRAVGDALKNVTTMARQQLEMIVQGRKIEFEGVKDALKAAARGSGSGRGEPLSGTERTAFERIGDGLVGADAMLVKMERVFRWLDGGKIGPWTEHFFQPVAEGQTIFNRLNREVALKLREAMLRLPKAVRRGLADTFEVDGFEQPINRRQLLTMALNQGNEGNQRVLREGYGLTQAQVDAAMRHLSADEARFVGEVWKVLETLREPAAALQKRLTGLEPEWVEPRPYVFETKDGPVQTDGGYFPLVRDPDRTTIGPKVDADALLEKGYMRATTSRGYLESRTGATYPLLLDFERILSRHVIGVTKDIAFREAAVSINRMMDDQTVRNAVDESLGREYRKQIIPWLRNVLNDSNDSSAQGLSTLSRGLAATRRNISAATIGFRLGSMLTIPTDLFRAWEPFRGAGATTTRVSTRHLTSAYLDFLSNPVRATKWVREMSGEMAFRPHALDRDIRSLFQQELIKPPLSGNPLDAVAAFRNHLTARAYDGFAIMDAMVSVPTWMGAYRQAMEAGLPEAHARLQADATVRLSLESGQPKDLVALQRNNDFAKLITMFNGWGFSAYDLMRSLGHEAKTPSGTARAAFYGLMGISAANVAAAYLSGHGPGKDESAGGWAARTGLLAPMEVIPVVRDLADYAVGRWAGTGGDMRFSPVFTMLEKTGKAVVAQGKFAAGDMEPGEYLTVTAEALGLLTGTPGTVQAAATAKYLRRVASGEERPDNGLELATGAALGKPKGR